MLRDLVRSVTGRRTRAAPSELQASDIQDPSGTSRRSLLGRGFMLVAGGIGLGVSGGIAPEARASAAHTSVGRAPALGTTQPALATLPVTMSLVVRDVRFKAPDLKPGVLPNGASVDLPHGKLWDLGGSAVSTFAGGMLPGSSGLIAFQRFTFSDGSLIGMGSGKLDGEEYAVVGGTGRYSGASGSYLIRLRPGATGRDAAFLVNVTGMKG